MAQTNLPYRQMTAVPLDGLGNMYYLGQNQYVSTDSGDYYWNTVARMLLQFNRVVNFSDFTRAIRETVPTWTFERLEVNDVGILLAIRYSSEVFNPSGVLTSWSARITQQYRAIRACRVNWPQGRKVNEGTYAIKVGGSNAKVVIFAKTQLYDAYGLNSEVMSLSLDEARITGFLSEEEIEALPAVYHLPCGFFD